MAQQRNTSRLYVGLASIYTHTSMPMCTGGLQIPTWYYVGREQMLDGSVSQTSRLPSPVSCSNTLEFLSQCRHKRFHIHRCFQQCRDTVTSYSRESVPSSTYGIERRCISRRTGYKLRSPIQHERSPSMSEEVYSQILVRQTGSNKQSSEHVH